MATVGVKGLTYNRPTTNRPLTSNQQVTRRHRRYTLPGIQYVLTKLFFSAVYLLLGLTSEPEHF